MSSLRDPENLSKWLANVISVECSKPDGDIDTDLIDECQALINILINIPEYTEAEIAERYNRVLIKTNAETKPIKQKKPPFLKWKGILAASVVVFVFFGFSVGLLAFNPTLRDMFFSIEAMSGVVGDCTWELQGRTLIIRGKGSTGDVKKPPWGTRIKRVIVEEGVTHLGGFLFRYCYDLYEVSLPSSLISIGESTFEYCDSLKNIVFPEGLESINSSAFQQCDKLKEVYIPKSVVTVGYMAFMNCASLKKITVDTDNLYYSDIDGVLFDKEQKVLICYPPSKQGESYDVPYGVVEICDYAFFGARNIKRFNIPSSVKKIGHGAFELTWFKNNGEYENGVLYIGSFAVDVDEQITVLRIKDGTTVLADIEFYELPYLESAVIPEGVTSLGVANFEIAPSLKNIFLPSTLEAIDRTLFKKTHSDFVIWYAGSLNDMIELRGVSSFVPPEAWEYEKCYNGKAHVMSVDSLTVQPTCETDGYEVRMCLVCKAMIRSTVYANGHTWSSLRKLRSATCTEGGQFQRSCEICGETETYTTKTSPHKMGDWVQTVAPTLTEPGILTRKCRDCLYTEESTVEPLGNTYGQ